MVRVLIVDGQAEVRRGLQMRLAIEPDMTVVGETGKVGEAVYLAQALDPDVIVVDVEMRGAEGVSLLRRLRAGAPAAYVIVLTLHGDKDLRARACEAGAQVFLEKCGGAADLVGVIRRLVACQSREGSRVVGTQRAGNVPAKSQPRFGLLRPKCGDQGGALWSGSEKKL